MFEENINIVNEIVDEENKNQKKQDSNSAAPNFNPSSIMSGMSSMMNKFK
jgi:hypothetical protein